MASHIMMGKKKNECSENLKRKLHCLTLLNDHIENATPQEHKLAILYIFLQKSDVLTAQDYEDHYFK